MKTKFHLAAVMIALAFPMAMSAATTYLWNGGAAGTWDTTNTNWNTATTPLWDATAGAGDIASFNTSGAVATVNAPIFVNGITFGAATTVGATAPADTITLSGVATITSNVTGNTISSILAGTPTSVTFSGAGSVTLSGANTYVGNNTISSGTTVLVGAAGAPAAGALGSDANSLTINAGGVFDLNGLGLYIGALNGGGTVTNNGAAANTLNLNGGGAAGTFSGVIKDGTSQTTALRIASQTETLTGANTYTGITNLTTSGGSLTVGDGTSGSISSVGQVRVASGATFIFNEADGSTLGNAFVQSTTSGTLKGNESSGHTNTVSGTIGNALSFVQSGVGKTILSNTNTYTGTTSVNAGTLSVTGSLANTAVTVASLATFEGSGSVAGLVTVNSGGILIAGDGLSSATHLSLSNGLTMNSGSVLSFVLGSGTSSTLVLGGTVTLNSGMKVDFLNIATGTYTVATGLSSNPGVSNWALTSDDSGYSAAFSYNAGSIQAVITTVPEPAPWALLAGGLAAVMAARGMRRRVLSPV